MTLLRRVVVAVVVVLILAGCHSPSSDPEPRSSRQRGGLSDDEVAKAVAIARAKVEAEDAKIKSATVTAEPGTIAHSNTGYRCSSGRLLRIELIGSFPYVVTTGMPTAGTDPARSDDFDIHGLLLIADAGSGRVCQISVQTGKVTPSPDAILLKWD